MGDYPIKWITNSVAVGYAPRSEADLHSIRQARVGAIVNLCAECYDLHDAETAFGFLVHYLPVVDEGAPTLAELEQLIAWMQSTLSSGHRLLVHCRYGIGRTGTIALSYLIQSGYGFKEAKAILRKTPSWPSNRVQQALVDQFLANIGHSSISEGYQSTRPRSVSKFFDRWKQLSKWA